MIFPSRMGAASRRARRYNTGRAEVDNTCGSTRTMRGRRPVGDELTWVLLRVASVFVAMVAAVYVAAPIVVYLVQRISAKPELLPFDAHATPLPQEAATHLGEVGAALEAEGFTPTSAFFLPRHAPHLKA